MVDHLVETAGVLPSEVMVYTKRSQNYWPGFGGSVNLEQQVGPNAVDCLRLLGGIPLLEDLLGSIFLARRRR